MLKIKRVKREKKTVSGAKNLNLISKGKQDFFLTPLIDIFTCFKHKIT